MRALDARIAAKPERVRVHAAVRGDGHGAVAKGTYYDKNTARGSNGAAGGFFEGVAEDMASWDGVAHPLPDLLQRTGSVPRSWARTRSRPSTAPRSRCGGTFSEKGAPPSRDTLSGTVSFRWNVFVGENFAFGGGHTVEDNVFLGGAEGCPSGSAPGRTSCASSTTTASSRIRGTAQGAMWAAVAIYGRKCSGFSSFDDNVAVGVVGRVSDPGRGLQLPRPRGPPELRWVDRGY